MGDARVTGVVTCALEASTPQVVTDTATITDPNVVATGGFTFTAAEGSATVSGTVAKIGRASGRERGEISGVAESLKKKNRRNRRTSTRKRQDNNNTT